MRLMACFGVVVLLVILDSLSKALATAEVSNVYEARYYINQY